MKFEEVIGQQEAKEKLTRMLDEHRVPHAIMLCGPTGIGKMALAMSFAEMLSPSPLDRHYSYPVIKTQSMTSDHKPISADFAEEWNEMVSNGAYFSINDWLLQIGAENQQAIITVGESNELIRKLSLRPHQGPYKTSVIWLPERMNGECANKMLKLLEEPPTDTVFLIVSEEPDKLLETIRSRAQRIDIRKIKNEDVFDALKQQRGLNDEDATTISRIANGNWHKAMELLDSENENAQFLELFISLMRLCYKRDVRELKKWSDDVAKLGRECQLRLLTYCQRMVRENFMYNFHNPELNYMTKGESNFAKNFARFINEANVVEINRLIDRCQRDIGQNANAKILFYDFTLKMIILLIKK